MKKNNNEIMPNLFIPGAAKSGTSSFHEYINQHPDIFMSSHKEPHYFSHDKHYFKKRDHYLQLFKDAENFKFRGESSTGYMALPKVIDRIKEEVEDPYFIFILRNPVDRAYSHYWWLKGMDIEKDSFEKAFNDDLEYYKEAFTDNEMEIPVFPKAVYGNYYKFYYITGLYGKWMKRYYNNFSKDRIHVVTTEELRADPLKTVNTCMEFLNLEPLKSIEQITSNKTAVLKVNKTYKLLLYLKKVLLVSDSVIKKPFRLIVPKSWRKKFHLGVHSMYLGYKKKISVTNKYDKLDAEGRKWVADNYRKDVELLRKVTGKDFPEWKDFS